MFYNIKKVTKDFIFGITPHIPFNRSLYLREINHRKNLHFTETHELAKPINFLSAFTYERHIPNEFYGHANTIKKFCGLPDNYQLKFSIEHGASPTKIVTRLDIDSPFQSIMVSGKPRSRLLKKYKQHVFTLGPYIYYAKPLLTDKQMQTEMKRLGNNLLVFPSHSTSDVNTSFDLDRFCRRIKKIGKSFDSIRICLYWKDILNHKDLIYKKFGFECVTAGHILDINFLPRLKSIILSSSATVSNNVGTHIGYCISLNKPHCVLKENFSYSGLKSEIEIVKKGLNDKNMKKTEQVFKKTNHKISKDQFKYINLHWGLDQIKTKKELLNIINFTESVYQKDKLKPWKKIIK